MNLVDFYFVRRGHYAITEIFKPNGIYGRWSWRGLVAYVVGFASMIPFLSTTFYVGPAAEAMNGADISFIVGLVVSGGLYLILCRAGLDLDAEQAAIVASDRELEQRESAPAPSIRHSGSRARQPFRWTRLWWWPAASSPRPWATRGANRERVADAVATPSHSAPASWCCRAGLQRLRLRGPSRGRGECGAPDHGETLTLWARLAADHQIVIVGGFCEQAASGEVFNSAALDDRSRRATQRLPQGAPLGRREPPVLTGEHRSSLVPTAYGRIGMLICYDLEIPEWIECPPWTVRNCSAPRSTGPRSHAPMVSGPRRSCACKRMPREPACSSLHATGPARNVASTGSAAR